ncbi:MAG: hypothetical protein QXH44_09215 [Pyrobaculum sp.]
MEDKRTILYTGPLWIYVKETGKYIRLAKRVRPIYPYGNYVEDNLELDLDENVLKYYTVRDSWNGTGCDRHGYVELTDEEAKEIAELMRSVKTAEDFEKLVEKFYELREEREKVAEELFDEVVDELVELVLADERIRTLKMTKEELREKAKEFIESLIEDDLVGDY